MSHTDALRQICGRLDRGEVDSRQFLELFTRELAVELGCARAGLWVFIGGAESRVLHNIGMYDALRGRMVGATDIEGPGVATYFDALVRDGCVVAPDALDHPATQGFREDLKRLDIRSLLDVCFSVNGNLFGAFSCEQIGQRADWTPRQVQRLRQVGAFASLTLLRAVHWQVDTAHGALWEISTPNRLATMPVPLDSVDPGKT